MDEEKKEGEKGFNLSKGFSSGVFWAIIGLILGVVLSFFAMMNIGVAAMSSMLTLGLGGGGFGLVCGFIYGVFPKNMKIVPIVMVIGVMIIVSIFLVNEAQLNTGWFGPSLHPIITRFEGIDDLFTDFRGDALACLSGDPSCPYLAVWEDTNIINNEEKVIVKLSSSNNKIFDDEINLLSSLTVTNSEEEDIEIFPKCYLGAEREEMDIINPGSYWTGSSFVFSQSEYEMSTSFRCHGISDKLSERIYVVLERPVFTTTTLPVSIINEKPKEYEGKVRSDMTYNAPYTVSVSCDIDMPLIQGNDYDFEIIIKKKERNVKFKKLESLTIMSLSEVFIDCPFGDQLNDVDYEQLKLISDYDPTRDEFRFLCSLYVADATENAIQSPIIAEAKYIVESEHKVLVSKQV